MSSVVGACTIEKPLDALRLGVAIIYQELDLFPNLSAGENMVVRNPRFEERGVVRPRRVEAFCRQFLRQVELECDLDAPAGSSFVDLTALIPEGEAPERALAYAQAWLFSEDPRAVACTLGTDDGCRVWLDEELVYENRDKKRANPLEKLARLELQPGWNRLVFQVENATGSFGLYCRVLDPEVLVSSEPR